MTEIEYRSSTELRACLAAVRKKIRIGAEERGSLIAEAGLCIVWGAPIAGREKQALYAFNEGWQYWEDLQLEGKIERFDVTVLAPTGGEVAGFLLVRGTAEQIDSLRRTKEYQQQVAGLQLVASHLSVADAYVDEGLVEIMGQYLDVLVRAE